MRSVIADASQAMFRRGQVDWALWQWFVAGKSAPREPPSTFLIRIKRLIEIDRKGRLPRGTHHLSVPRYAFFDEPPEGTGADMKYSPLSVFCLAIGLDLLDAGFSQFEVAFLIRGIRPFLAPQYQWALNHPPSVLGPIPHEDPREPFILRNRLKLADRRIFMLVNKVDISEQFSQTFKTPIILEPQFYHGLEALLMGLDKLDYNDRRAFVLEIAHTAVQVSKLLLEAPMVKRGRQPRGQHP